MGVNRLSNWKSRLDSLDSKERETLLGTSLSKLFTKLPLWMSHPANIGGFYGILVAIALLLPYRFASDDYSGWLSDWGLHCCLLLVACFFLGICSTIIVSITGRFPTAPPRAILYPMPFLGLALLTIDRTDIIEIPAMISWIFMRWNSYGFIGFQRISYGIQWFSCVFHRFPLGFMWFQRFPWT